MPKNTKYIAPPIKQFVSVDEWGLTYDEYKNGGWGNLSGGELKIPREVAIRYTRNNKVDIDKIFKELAENVISAIKNRYPILNHIPFKALVRPQTLHYLEVAVYKAIQFNASNGTLLQLVNPQLVSTPDYAIQRSTTNWVLTDDQLGRQAMNALHQSGIQDFEIVENPVTYARTQSGNIQIIGKFDADKIPDLVEIYN